jgi:tyrosyl-tRNA synthetase
MSKSLGNHIALLLEPADMYGKVMSVPDKAMGDFYRFITRLTPAEIEAIEADLKSGKLHPRDVKMKLAFEIVSIYHSEAAAEEAQAAFVRVFQQGEVPEEMPSYHLQDGQTVLDVLADSGIVSSRGEGRRMIKQNAVSLDDDKLVDPFAPFPGPGVLRVGRRKFIQIIK